MAESKRPRLLTQQLSCESLKSADSEGGKSTASSAAQSGCAESAESSYVGRKSSLSSSSKKEPSPQKQSTLFAFGKVVFRTNTGKQIEQVGSPVIESAAKPFKCLHCVSSFKSEQGRVSHANHVHKALLQELQDNAVAHKKQTLLTGSEIKGVAPMSFSSSAWLPSMVGSQSMTPGALLEVHKEFHGLARAGKNQVKKKKGGQPGDRAAYTNVLARQVVEWMEAHGANVTDAHDNFRHAVSGRSTIQRWWNNKDQVKEKAALEERGELLEGRGQSRRSGAVKKFESVLAISLRNRRRHGKVLNPRLLGAILQREKWKALMATIKYRGQDNACTLNVTLQFCTVHVNFSNNTVYSTVSTVQ